MRSATNMPMELHDFLKRENINTSNVFSFKLGLKVHFIIYILTLFHIVSSMIWCLSPLVMAFLMHS